jgi:hypothetical protein
MAINNNSFSLSNTEHFNNTLETTFYEILNKYTNLINEYTKFISENFSNKNKTYSKFILIRGLDTITNVFNHVFFYTKNIDISYFHSQKAYYFYMEFIEQISNDNNTFLQLSSRDATLYVYKKTIFEINIEYKKKIELSFQQEEEKQKHFLLNKYIKIYKILFSKFLDFYIDFFINKENEKDEEFGKKLVLQDFEKLCKHINNLNFSENELELLPIHLNKFINIYKEDKNTQFLKSILDVIKQIKKNKL